MAMTSALAGNSLSFSHASSVPGGKVEVEIMSTLCTLDKHRFKMSRKFPMGKEFSSDSTTNA